MPFVQFEVEYEVEIKKNGSWYPHGRPNASLNAVVRQARSLAALRLYDKDDIRVIKDTKSREVLEIDLE